MPVEMIQQMQAAQTMLLAAFEFIALSTCLLVCAGLLLWLAGMAFLSYGEWRQQHRAAIAVRKPLSTTSSNNRCLINHNPVSERSQSL